MPAVLEVVGAPDEGDAESVRSDAGMSVCDDGGDMYDALACVCVVEEGDDDPDDAVPLSLSLLLDAEEVVGAGGAAAVPVFPASGRTAEEAMTRWRCTASKGAVTLALAPSKPRVLLRWPDVPDLFGSGGGDHEPVHGFRVMKGWCSA